ncbi:MAG: RNA polymerase sigma factor, partial [Planctomycetota bacterium]
MTQIPETIADPQTLSDGVLLRRFVQDANEHAFAIIVERHAGLVMSVCRRVVGQSADCDDAFQATFYALSQRPDSIRECRSLTGWLYSVAWRTSVRLVRLRKRSKMETLPDQVQSGHSDPYERIAEANDLAALDEELNQLPDKYRHVLVMNYFAQQSSQDIADQLNESKGTIDGRIREGKRMLRVRLARRGVQVGVLAIATSLTQSASASISPALISSTTQFAQLSSGFGSIAGVHGIDLAQMQVLSSAGVKVMGIQAGTFLATGLLMLTGALGISQLMARPDGTAQNASSVAEAIDTTPQDPSETKPLTGEIDATGDAPPDSAAAIAIQDEQGSQPEPSGEQDRRGNLASLEGITGGGTGGMGGTDEPLDPTQNGGKAEFSTGTSRGIQQQLHQVIYSRPLPATLHFTGDVPLAEALDQLQTAINNESEQKVRFMLDTSDWAFADDVEFLNRTQISGLSVEQDTMTIASALDHIFSRVIDVQLTWVVKDEIILVTTEDVAKSPRHALIRSYDV